MPCVSCISVCKSRSTLPSLFSSFLWQTFQISYSYKIHSQKLDAILNFYQRLQNNSLSTFISTNSNKKLQSSKLCFSLLSLRKVEKRCFLFCFVLNQIWGPHYKINNYICLIPLLRKASNSLRRKQELK